MRGAIVASLLLLCLFAVALQVVQSFETDESKELWTEFVRKYEKKYSSPRAELARFEIFQASFAFLPLFYVSLY